MDSPGVALATVVLLSCTVAGAADLYVSPAGNDGWSGRLAQPNADRTDGPLASLSAAQTAARQLIAAGLPAGGLTVHIGAGFYELSAALSFGPEDSGTAESPVVWRGEGAEPPALVGSRAVGKFEPWRNGILQCRLVDTPLAGRRFRQLFCGGERMVLARYPNVDPTDPHFGQWAYVLKANRKQADRFYATSDVIKDWTHLERAEVCIHPSYGWAWAVVPIASADRASGLIVLQRGTHYGQMIGDRYYVQNLLEELDAPGEWYLDPDEGWLYFLPPDGSNKAEVRAPVTDTLIAIQGARHLTVRGLRLEQCDGTAVTIRDSEDCRVAGCTIRHCGAWAVTISGGRRCGAVGCDISATGAGGVSITGGDAKTLEPAGNYADNNYIHHIAAFQRTYHTGVNLTGVGNRASHNLIHDCYHQGILMGGNDNVAEYNIVHHTNLGSEDTGGLYMSSRNYLVRGNVIRYNIFHHVGGFGKANSWRPVVDGRVRFEYPHFTWGIYLDAPETGVHVYGNLLYAVPVCGLFNHSGKDNTWENNIIVDAPAFRASVWGGMELFTQSMSYVTKAREEGWLGVYLARYPELERYRGGEARPNAMFNCRFERNIVYYTPNGGQWLRERNRAAWDGGQLVWTYRGHRDDFREFVFDNNLVYAPEGITPKFELHLEPDGRKLLDWDGWRATGQDAHSLMADPRFVDPQRHDYRLQPDSPALQLGFQPIPFEQIGPYEDELRASWPVVEAPGAAALGEFVTERYFELPGHEPAKAEAVVVRRGVGRLARRLAAGQSVTLACFAGGNHAQGGWFTAFLETFGAAHPSVEVKGVLASIHGGARGSRFSVYRFRREILSHHPDLVFVDFAADDHETDFDTIQESIEGVVRQAWGGEEPPDLVFVYAFRPGYETAYEQGVCPEPVSAYERLAEHYGIPSINLGVDITALAREGKLRLRATAEEARQSERPVFTTDGVYTTAAANAIYAERVGRAMDEFLAAPTTERAGPLPEPLQPANLERARQLEITPEMLGGDWTAEPPGDHAQHFPRIWVTRSPGATLTFRFRGTDASIMDLLGPDTGRVRVTIDGQDRGVREQYDRWCWFYRIGALSLASGLDDREHTVIVELLSDPPDRSAAIAEAKQAGRYDAAAFEGVSLRFGCIQIIGEAVE